MNKKSRASKIIFSFSLCVCLAFSSLSTSFAYLINGDSVVAPDEYFKDENTYPSIGMDKRDFLGNDVSTREAAIAVASTILKASGQGWLTEEDFYKDVLKLAPSYEEDIEAVRSGSSSGGRGNIKIDSYNKFSLTDEGLLDLHTTFAFRNMPNYNPDSPIQVGQFSYRSWTYFGDDISDMKLLSIGVQTPPSGYSGTIMNAPLTIWPSKTRTFFNVDTSTETDIYSVPTKLKPLDNYGSNVYPEYVGFYFSSDKKIHMSVNGQYWSSTPILRDYVFSGSYYVEPVLYRVPSGNYYFGFLFYEFNTGKVIASNSVQMWYFTNGFVPVTDSSSAEIVIPPVTNNYYISSSSFTTTDNGDKITNISNIYNYYTYEDIVNRDDINDSITSYPSSNVPELNITEDSSESFLSKLFDSFMSIFHIDFEGVSTVFSNLLERVKSLFGHFNKFFDLFAHFLPSPFAYLVYALLGCGILLGSGRIIIGFVKFVLDIALKIVDFFV